MTKPVLGRGLGALLGGGSSTAAPSAMRAENATPSADPDSPPGTKVERVALDRIRPCAFQPRRRFAPEELQELADSIREQGVLQPLIVRAAGEGFELIAGERRWRASRLAELREVPVLIREATDLEVIELALIENLQREDLNPIEEAEGYRQLADKFDLRQEDIATRVGKSRVSIANALRLLKLPENPRSYVQNGQLSVGHAKVILGLDSPEHHTIAADRVIRQSLNVRQTEDLVARLRGSISKPDRAEKSPRSNIADPNVEALESKLQERLGTRVRLKYQGGKGTLEVRFFSDEDLERVLEVMGVGSD